MLIIHSDLERRLLVHFFMNEGTEEYLHELARKLKVDPGNLDKKIKKLEKEGLFISASRGKQRYYTLNKKFPLLQEYRAIIQKTYGVEARIAKELKHLKGLSQAILFGSYAKGEWKLMSDIDLLLIGDFNPISASKILTKLEKEFGREINAVEMGSKEFETKKQHKNELLENIFKHSFIKLL